MQLPQTGIHSEDRCRQAGNTSVDISPDMIDNSILLHIEKDDSSYYHEMSIKT